MNPNRHRGPGRPRLPTLVELGQRSASEEKEKEEVLHVRPSTLPNLKRLWLRNRNGGSSG